MVRQILSERIEGINICNLCKSETYGHDATMAHMRDHVLALLQEGKSPETMTENDAAVSEPITKRRSPSIDQGSVSISQAPETKRQCQRDAAVYRYIAKRRSPSPNQGSLSNNQAAGNKKQCQRDTAMSRTIPKRRFLNVDQESIPENKKPCLHTINETIKSKQSVEAVETMETQEQGNNHVSRGAETIHDTQAVTGNLDVTQANDRREPIHTSSRSKATWEPISSKKATWKLRPEKEGKSKDLRDLFQVRQKPKK